MTHNNVILFLIALILGWFIYIMMGDGFSVGGEETDKEEIKPEKKYTTCWCTAGRQSISCGKYQPQYGQVKNQPVATGGKCSLEKNETYGKGICLVNASQNTITLDKHLTNNFDFLLKNINQTLNNEGFFIATIPGINCFHELKNSMMLADIEIYGGAYRRFLESFSVNTVSSLLKKNNYKIPVIEVDTLELRYKEFSSLLRDVRYLGNSNIYKDRKKLFERKTYFKKVEEIYLKNYSNNDQFILQLEILYITAWKEN